LYFDRIPAIVLSAAPEAQVVIRSGAYILHDDGIYEQRSPLSRANNPTLPEDRLLLPAARAYGRVHSRPERALAIVEGGKRDYAYDEGLPVPLRYQTRDGEWRGLAPGGARAVNTNDHHTFVEVEPGSPLAVGDLVEFGLSHPCTIMDKWRWVPVTAGGRDRQRIVDVYRTWF
jgi:D-serine deaminase-like pyridoxal phosphate-dependent protein